MNIPLPSYITNNRYRSENSEVWHGDTLIARCPTFAMAIELQRALNRLSAIETQAQTPTLPTDWSRFGE